MRIIRVKLSEAAKLACDQVAERLNCNSVGLVQDMFAFIHTDFSGLPDDVRCDKLGQFYATGSQFPEHALVGMIKKRRSFLKSLAVQPGFQALKNKPDRIESLYRFLVDFKLIAKTTQVSKCLNCEHLKNCDFGKQYGNSNLSVAAAMNLSPDLNLTVHKDCPAKPSGSLEDQVQQAMNQLSKLTEDPELTDAMSEESRDDVTSPYGSKTETTAAQQYAEAQQVLEDEIELTDSNSDIMDCLDPREDYRDLSKVEGAGKGTQRSTRTGSSFEQIHDNMVKEVTSSKAVIFEYARKFEEAVMEVAKDKLRRTNHVSKLKEIAPLKKISEITKAANVEISRPEHIQDMRIASGQFQVKAQMQPEAKKQLLYLLIDESGSMGSALGGYSASASSVDVDKFIGVLSREGLSKLICISLAERVLMEKGVMFLRFFAGGTSKLYSLKSQDEFADFKKEVLANDYCGGGTNIRLALEAANADITSASAVDPLITKAEIMLITDCDDHVSEADLKANIKTPFCVVDVSGESDVTNHELAVCADKYYKFRADASSLSNLVDVATYDPVNRKATYGNQN